MRLKLVYRDIAYAVGLVLGLGITWGSLTTRVSAQEELTKSLPGSAIRLSVLETKLDYLTGLVEYSMNLRASRPSRPASQGQ